MSNNQLWGFEMREGWKYFFSEEIIGFLDDKKSILDLVHDWPQFLQLDFKGFEDGIGIDFFIVANQKLSHFGNVWKVIGLQGSFGF